MLLGMSCLWGSVNYFQIEIRNVCECNGGMHFKAHKRKCLNSWKWSFL